MFSPKEYLSLEEFHGLCGLAAQNWMEEFRRDPDEGESAELVHVIGTQIFTIWLICTAFQQVDVMICSPDGVVHGSKCSPQRAPTSPYVRLAPPLLPL